MAVDDPLAPYRNAVTPEAPAGDDLTYDEAYLKIREEIDRAGTVSVHVDHERALEGGAISADGGVDFAAVAQSARELLSGPTRDLQLAAYLTLALARQNGAEGLAEGMEITSALLEAFGDGVHPLKPVRRRNALQYLADRMKEWATDRAFSGADVPSLERARARAATIQEWTIGQMGDGAPALSGLLQALDEGLRRATKETRAPDGPAATTNGATAHAPAPAPATAAPTSISSESDARRAVHLAAAFLREQAPAHPLAYRLSRAIAWGGLTALPPSQNGKTVIDAPDATTRARFDGISDPAARVRAAEETFPGKALWLDLQRIAVQAAEQGGTALHEVRNAITEETAGLLRRLPDLRTLTFADGTPLADASTQAWFDTFTQDSASGANSVSAGASEALEEALEIARSAAATGDVAAAVGGLHDARTGSGMRDRFIRGLHVARICQQAGRLDVAVALLDGLVQEVDTWRLVDWEPSLAVECLRLAHSAWTATQASAPAGEREAAAARAKEVYALLCRVAPGAAMAIGGRPDKKGSRV